MYFGMRCGAKHVPGMNQHRRAFVRAMMQEGHDARIVEIFLANVIADLHSQMSGAHAPAQFLARRVNILQRNLAQRFQPALALRAQFQRRIVEQARAIQRVLHGTIVREQHRSGRENLHLDAVPVHFVEPHFGIPARRIDLAEESIAHHDVRFPGLGVLDPRPVGSAVARRQIRPGAREEMIVDVDDWHVHCLPG